MFHLKCFIFIDLSKCRCINLSSCFPCFERLFPMGKQTNIQTDRQTEPPANGNWSHSDYSS